MTRPVRYLALPMASGDGVLVAYWPDGRMALCVAPNVLPLTWRAINGPDYAELFPHTAPPEGVADQNDARAAREALANPHRTSWAAIKPTLSPPRPAGESP